jgi:hypothetical protein
MNEPTNDNKRMPVQMAQIYALIPKVSASIGAVGKTQQNRDQNYKFRGIAELMNAAHPAMMEHGVFCVPEIIDHVTTEKLTKSGNTMFRVVIQVRHRFYASDGSFVEAVTYGEAMDTSDKATNKAMSFAFKYAMNIVFCIPYAAMEEGDEQSMNDGPARTTAPTKIGTPNVKRIDTSKYQSSAPKPPVSSYDDPAPPPVTPAPTSFIDQLEASVAQLPKAKFPDASAHFEREPGSDDDDPTPTGYIDDRPIGLPLQRALHIDYKEAYKGDKRQAQSAMAANLKALGYVGTDGNGSTKAIQQSQYADVRATLLKAANNGGVL